MNWMNWKKLEAISTKDYSFFLGRIYFTSDNGSQNLFVYQPTFSTIKYHNTITEYVISWRSKILYTTNLAPINNYLLPNIVNFNKTIALQFDSTPLVLDQNNYIARTVSTYIVYDSDYWPKDPLGNFVLKNCLFGVINIVKNSDREKFVYSGYGIASDGKSEWSSANETARNVIVSGVDNSSSSHTDNFKNIF